MNHIFVSSQEQRLFFFQKGRCQKSYLISTARNGLGEEEGSYCTPRGWHKVVEIIGLTDPIHTIFKARKSNGEQYSSELSKKYANQDWILSRIIRLKGLELGFNLGGKVDSCHRCIYIHGTNAENCLGQPVSHGCIRMSNLEIIEFADLLKPLDSVFIA